MGEAKKSAGTFEKDVTQSMSNVAKETKSSSFSWTELNSAIMIGRQAIDLAKKAYDAVITPTIAYAAEVRDLARISGESAESTSRLIQVADDMAVSFDTLKTAARAAAQKGISMSTESLAKLSDQYLKLKPGAERATFLIDTFGRSGLEMGKLLDKGSEAITRMSASIDDSLIMTQKGIEEARKYEIAVDNLGDSWAGFTMTLGKTVVPLLSEFVTNLNLGLGAITGNSSAIDNLNARYKAWQDLHPDATAGELAAAYRDLKLPVDEASTALGDMTAASDALNVRMQDTKFYADMVRGAFFDMRDATIEATRQFIIQQAMLGLDSEAQLNLGLALGIVQQETYETVTAIMAAKLAADQNRDGMLSAAEAAGRYTDKVRDLANSLNSLTSKNLDIVINYWKHTYDIPEGHALGGHFSAGEDIVVGEKGSELVRFDRSGTVFPHNATPGASLSSGRSGGSTINLNVNVSGTIGDPQETGRQMVPALRYALRELGVTGG